MTHELKILPQYFEHVLSGNKTFEHRLNDRGFQTGDNVVLKEYSKEEVFDGYTQSLNPSEWMKEKGYTGRYTECKIGYVLPVENNHVVFSLLKSDV